MQSRDVMHLETGLQSSSPYYFGDGILERFPGYLKEHDFDRCYLVTSKKLFDLFGGPLVRVLDSAHVPCELVLINETERHKDWDTLGKLCEELVARGVTKDSILVGVGGGVIGNVVGLAAALVYRGIRFVEVPTTVTSQTDGTLSNKQAINGRQGKNQFGTYHAPLFIWADAAYSKGEPTRQKRAGIVEGIKNVLIAHEDVQDAEKMLELWACPDRFVELLLLLIQSKLDILRRDPTERGYGVVLEYGHTFGHAIEWLARGALLHGEAVSIGMCLAAELSHALGYQSPEFLQEHYRLLRRLGTATQLPESLSAEALYDAMQADNKRNKRGVEFLLLEKCGQFVDPNGNYQVPVESEKVMQTLQRLVPFSKRNRRPRPEPVPRRANQTEQLRPASVGRPFQADVIDGPEGPSYQ
jgi:3-dehydroquinate synthase